MYVVYNHNLSYKDGGGIYCITNKLNGKMYVGSAVSFVKRCGKHFWELKKNIHGNKKLQCSYNKHGEENFTFKILARCPKEYLIKLEQFFIDTLKPHYNILQFAHSAAGLKRTVREKAIISKTHKGRKLTEEHKRKVSENNRSKKPIYQYTQKGVYLKEYPTVTAAAKEFGINRTHLATASRIGRWHHGFQWRYYKVDKIPQYINDTTLPKTVYNYDFEGNFIGEYQSITLASKSMGGSVKDASITAAIKGRIKSAYGYQWKDYKTEKISPYTRDVYRGGSRKRAA